MKTASFIKSHIHKLQDIRMFKRLKIGKCINEQPFFQALSPSEFLNQLKEADGQLLTDLRNFCM